MKTPLLIGIHGVKRSGKGTAFHFVKEWGGALGLSARERGFADMVKWSLARIFYPDIMMKDAVKWVDDLKEDVDAFLYASDKDAPHSEIVITMREAVQHVGTEMGRDLYGYDFWLDQLLPYHQQGDGLLRQWSDGFLVEDKVADICGVTDLRFANEFDRLKLLSGVAIKIRRRVAEQAVIDEATAKGRELHKSELGLPDEWFDHVVSNDGTKDELATKIRTIMDEYKSRK